MDFRPLCLAAVVAVSVAPQQAAAEAAEEWRAGCLVTGLDPNGDGFLSIRTGPGTGNPEIARVANGDALYFDSRQCQGKWCFAHGGSINDREVAIRGWFYTAWCQLYP